MEKKRVIVKPMVHVVAKNVGRRVGKKEGDRTVTIKPRGLKNQLLSRKFETLRHLLLVSRCDNRHQKSTAVDYSLQSTIVNNARSTTSSSVTSPPHSTSQQHSTAVNSSASPSSSTSSSNSHRCEGFVFAILTILSRIFFLLLFSPSPIFPAKQWSITWLV